MRGFFFLLLITNVLFFSWQVWREPQNKETLPYGGMSLENEGMTLLTELDEAKRPAPRKLMAIEDTPASPVAAGIELVAVENTIAAAGVESTSPPAISNSNCYRSILLESLEAAQTLQQSLAEMGITKTNRETVQAQKINYWVMLPADKDLSKVNDVLELLKKRRVKDFFVVRSGRYENAISLGVYSTRERAEQRYKEISALKLRQFKPQIEALELPAKRLVVTFQLESNEMPKEMAPLLDHDKQPQVQKISCN